MPNEDVFFACATGAPRRMEKILNSYGKTLKDLGFPGTAGASEEEVRLEWSNHVKEEARRLGFLPHLAAKLDTYPAAMRAHLHRVCFTIAGDAFDGFPPYIKLGHRHARVGMAFKNYYLRRYFYGARAACMWCATPEAECGAHLIECAALPQALAPQLHETLVLTSHQDSGQAPPAAHLAAAIPLTAENRAHAVECLLRLHWEGMKESSVLRVLRFISTLINTYRRSWQPGPGQSPHQNPIKQMAQVPLRI